MRLLVVNRLQNLLFPDPLHELLFCFDQRVFRVLHECREDRNCLQLSVQKVRKQKTANQIQLELLHDFLSLLHCLYSFKELSHRRDHCLVPFFGEISDRHVVALVDVVQNALTEMGNVLQGPFAVEEGMNAHQEAYHFAGGLNVELLAGH